MLRLKDGLIEYNYNFCQQCGACLSACPKQAISQCILPNGLSKIVVNGDSCIRCKRCVAICPANRNDSCDRQYADFSNYKYFLSHNADEGIRYAQTSGGAAKTMGIECLRSGLIDGLYCLKKTDSYPFAEGEFYTHENIPAYDDIPNSIYHSVMASRELYKVYRCKNLMVIGTTCQLYAAERVLKGKCENLIKIVIFCKQQKTKGSLRYLAKLSKVKLPKDDNYQLSYRGDGWTGNTTFLGRKIPYKDFSYLPFGKRLWTVPGCNACVDPYGVNIEADIAILDPRYICKEGSTGESLLVVMSKTGNELVQKTPELVSSVIDYSEVLPALGLNDIHLKRATAACYRGNKVSTLVGIATKLEFMNRRILEGVVGFLPSMPLAFYKSISKILPNWRDILIR